MPRNVEQNRAHVREYAMRFPERRRARGIRLKTTVLSNYGPGGVARCSWPDCVVDDLDVLSLDHIEDDGAVHRKQRGIASGQQTYAHLIKAGFPSGYQTLCMNHQWKKQLERNRVRLRKRAESYLEAIA